MDPGLQSRGNYITSRYKKSASLRAKNNAGRLSTADEPLSEFIIKWPCCMTII